MPLMTVGDYLDRFYTASSRPNKYTVYRWIKNGILPAEKRGKQYYIDTDKIKQNTGNDIANRILNE